MKQKMFLFMVAGPVQCELCVTPGKLMIHTVSVAELELGQEGGAAPATTFLPFHFFFSHFFTFIAPGLTGIVGGRPRV